jgi:hypothetical protein
MERETAVYLTNNSCERITAFPSTKPVEIGAAVCIVGFKGWGLGFEG